MKRAIGLLLLAAPLALAAAERDEQWVSKRVREIRDSDTEAWRRIPWCANLLDAARLAGKEERLMFLFSHDGNIDTGRC